MAAQWDMAEVRNHQNKYKKTVWEYKLYIIYYIKLYIVYNIYILYIQKWCIFEISGWTQLNWNEMHIFRRKPHLGEKRHLSGVWVEIVGGGELGGVHENGDDLRSRKNDEGVGVHRATNRESIEELEITLAKKIEMVRAMNFDSDDWNR